jgi:hypothetical protein
MREARRPRNSVDYYLNFTGVFRGTFFSSFLAPSFFAVLVGFMILFLQEFCISYFATM